MKYCAFLKQTTADNNDKESYMDPILEEHGLTTFFLIFTFIPVGAGLVMLLINKKLIKMMHGIR